MQPPNIQVVMESPDFKLLEASFNDFSGQLNCNHEGLEILLPPYPVHQLKWQGRVIEKGPQSALIFSIQEPHQEIFYNLQAHLRSLVIDEKFLTRMCEPLNIVGSHIRFNPIEVDVRSSIYKSLQGFQSLTTAQAAQGVTCLSDCMVTDLTYHLIQLPEFQLAEKIRVSLQAGHFPSIIDRSRIIMKKNLFNTLFALDSLAKTSGVSKFHLIKVFKSSLGVSPMKYLNQMRIEFSKTLLLETKQTVVNIAAETGFNDLSNFNKSFKRTTGITPSQFRKNFNLIDR